MWPRLGLGFVIWDHLGKPVMAIFDLAIVFIYTSWWNVDNAIRHLQVIGDSLDRLIIESDIEDLISFLIGEHAFPPLAVVPIVHYIAYLAFYLESYRFTFISREENSLTPLLAKLGP